MEENQYVIISKIALEKRIENLEKIGGVITSHLIKELKQILSQSTPLIPEIEKGVRQGLSICLAKEDWAYGISGSANQDVKDYISNLKLGI